MNGKARQTDEVEVKDVDGEMGDEEEPAREMEDKAPARYPTRDENHLTGMEPKCQTTCDDEHIRGGVV